MDVCFCRGFSNALKNNKIFDLFLKRLTKMAATATRSLGSGGWIETLLRMGLHFLMADIFYGPGSIITIWLRLRRTLVRSAILLN
jgi:hypothetical protein